MITTIDTNVLLDVFGADAKFGEASAEAMRQCLSDGALIACEAVWAETTTAFQSSDKFGRAMTDLAVTFEPLNQTAAITAAEAWRCYRARGGRRTRIASYFLIGVHALSTADPLLTCDRDFYPRYFAGLKCWIRRPDGGLF